MLTVLPSRFKTIIIFAAVLLGVSVASAVQADVQACFNFLNAQDYTRAKNEAKQLLQRGNLNRIDERYAQLCLGRAYYEMGRNQDALPAFQRVEALSQTTEDLAVAYNFLGLTYDGLNDFDRAELYGQRYLKATRELGDKDKEATALNNLAGLADVRGDQVRALKLYQESLAMKTKAKQAPTLSNIALIKSARKEYKPAIKLLRQAIQIDRSNGNTHSTAIHQINLGDVLRRDKQYAAAEKELLTGLNAIRLVGDKSWEVDACESLGWLAVADGNPKNDVDEARQWMGKAEAIYREIGDADNADRLAKLLAGK